MTKPIDSQAAEEKIARPRKKRYKLADLLSKMDPSKRHGEVDWGKPVGKEVIDYDALVSDVSKRYPKTLKRLAE